jgi:hypothetical protein
LLVEGNVVLDEELDVFVFGRELLVMFLLVGDVSVVLDVPNNMN